MFSIMMYHSPTKGEGVGHFINTKFGGGGVAKSLKSIICIFYNLLCNVLQQFVALTVAVYDMSSL